MHRRPIRDTAPSGRHDATLRAAPVRGVDTRADLSRLAPPDGVVAPAEPLQHRRIVQISAIEHHGRTHCPCHGLQVRTAKFRPFRDDRQSVATLKRLHGRGAQGEIVPLAIDGPCFAHRNRVISAHPHIYFVIFKIIYSKRRSNVLIFFYITTIQPQKPSQKPQF